MKTAIGIIVAVGIMVAGYLATVASPHMREIWFVPNALGVWADSHPNARTAIPFALLAGLSVLIWSGRPLGAAILVIFLVMAGTEMVQMWLPARVFDLKDIGWGTLGMLIGLSGGYLWRRFWRAIWGDREIYSKNPLPTKSRVDVLEPAD